MEHELLYWYRLRVEEDERVHAYCSSLPDAIISGDDVAEADTAMREALEAVVRGRLKLGLPLEPPGPRGADEDRAHALPPLLAAKASLYVTWRASGLSKVALAERLGCGEKDVRRLFDPGHGSGLERMGDAARALGADLIVGWRPVV